MLFNYWLTDWLTDLLSIVLYLGFIAIICNFTESFNVRKYILLYLLYFGACFKQGVSHSGNYRVWIHSEMCMWHDKMNIQSVCAFLAWPYIAVFKILIILGVLLVMDFGGSCPCIIAMVSTSQHNMTLKIEKPLLHLYLKILLLNINFWFFIFVYIVFFFKLQ